VLTLAGVDQYIALPLDVNTCPAVPVDPLALTVGIVTVPVNVGLAKLALVLSWVLVANVLLTYVLVANVLLTYVLVANCAVLTLAGVDQYTEDPLDDNTCPAEPLVPFAIRRFIVALLDTSTLSTDID
jgi:hypothetical protein